MKKWSLWAFVIGVLALSACNDVEDLYDPVKAMERKLAMYESAFVKEFGKIAPNQDWGFGSVETRAGDYGNFAEPTSVAKEEKEAVKQWFKENPNPTDYVTTLPWSDFYIQHVYKTASNSKRLQKVCWKSENDSKWNEGFQSGHDNDQKDRVVTGMKGNVSFACGENGKGNPKYTDKHVIVEIDGSYYIRFKIDDDDDDDDDDDNEVWILKLSPAQYSNARRVIAEDLGTTGDFDFNDVVFDVSSGDGRTIITVRAAGGTLPLSVAGQEVHGLFGVDETEMVNTVPGEKRLMPVMFSINGVLAANAVEITVNGYSAEEVYTLKAEQGIAPQKLCVGTDFEWTDEKQNLKEKYPKFEEYVSNPNLKDTWWKN